MTERHGLAPIRLLVAVLELCQSCCDAEKSMLPVTTPDATETDEQQTPGGT